MHSPVDKPVLSLSRMAIHAVLLIAVLLAACRPPDQDAAPDAMAEAPTAAAASIITLPPVRELEDGGTTTCANGRGAGHPLSGSPRGPLFGSAGVSS